MITTAAKKKNNIKHILKIKLIEKLTFIILGGSISKQSYIKFTKGVT